MSAQRWSGPPCGCQRAGEHDGCAVDRARQAEALVELLMVLEPRKVTPDPCSGRCRTLGIDEVQYYAAQYGVCPCHLPGGQHGEH